MSGYVVAQLDEIDETGRDTGHRIISMTRRTRTRSSIWFTAGTRGPSSTVSRSNPTLGV